MKIRMTEREVIVFDKLLDVATIYVEYGIGGSTELACQKSLRRYYCVESDREWIAACSDVPVIKERLNTELQFVYADIGPTGKWGHPVGPLKPSVAERYYGAVWESVRHDASDRMLTLVDGRFRVACMCMALLKSRPGDIVCIHDYADREHYKILGDLLEFKSEDTLAFAYVPVELNMDRVREVLKLHAVDSR